ncbi:MAG: hypothetical protein BWY92_01846 [Firmicutes bacterium ADurb.BinA052]|nr:MAG: hypothetical protein BWY92_01846 [Firmicutes bacterium ADurb.BinA052]
MFGVAVARVMVGPASMWTTRSTKSAGFAGSLVVISRYFRTSWPGLPSSAALIVTARSAVVPWGMAPLEGWTLMPALSGISVLTKYT